MKITQIPSAEEINILFQNFKNISLVADDSATNEPVNSSIIHIMSDKDSNDTPENSALDQLMKMEGLEEVKEAIRLQLSYSSVMKLRKDFGMKVPNRVFNIILTGDPGTGKTTVARLIGRIFHENGLLSQGHTVEANRASLIGRYIGDTEANTTAKINEAKGGILLIDELYALTSEVSETAGETRDFGIKVIDTLIPVISNPDSDLIVIGCGYKKEMTKFLNANPGLASRFPMVLHFENLSLDQLLSITISKLRDFDYSISDDAIVAIRSLTEKGMKIKNFGNARFAVSLAENFIIPAVCVRTFKASVGENLSLEKLRELSEVEVSDVPSFEKMFPLATPKRATVGFNIKNNP